MKKLIFLLTLLSSFLVSFNTFSFDSCQLTLEKAERQGEEASRQLKNIEEKYPEAKAYYEDGKLIQALQAINSVEVSLYQSRSYYVLALYSLAHASEVCGESADVINQLRTEWTEELKDLDSVESDARELKDLILVGLTTSTSF